MPALELDFCRRSGLIHYQVKTKNKSCCGAATRDMKRREMADEAYRDEELLLLGYARELDFYELERVGVDPEGRHLVSDPISG
jgi:ribosomal protein L37E